MENTENRIRISSNSIYWERTGSKPTDWILFKRIEFSTKRRTYGWVELVGEKVYAYVPKIPDQDGNDAEFVGIFPNSAEAMAAVEEANHPNWGYGI